PPTSSRQRRTPIVDEKPVQTARALSPSAVTREEIRFAQQAVQLADHEVDLAFNYEMRYAKEHPAPPTPKTKDLYGRVSRTQAQVKDDQNLLDELKKAATAKNAKTADLQQQIAIVEAQLELDQDEFEDAQQDLRRSGIDRLSRVQRQFARYQA